MAHGVVRTDKMFGTDNRTGLCSVKYFVSTTPTAIDNGNVVLVGDLITGEREIYSATTPAANSDLKDIGLIATPEMKYCQCDYALDKFENEAGAPARAYRLTPGCIFSVTADALSSASTPAVGNLVELAAGTKLKVVSSATSGSTQVGKIIDINTVGGLTFYVIQVG
ncbi:MAG: hypothetical protein IKI58_04110 [Oscillospiraceae bacterium]|nr:hypothetical protein [Oscillospiraceae bacterium]